MRRFHPSYTFVLPSIKVSASHHSTLKRSTIVTNWGQMGHKFSKLQVPIVDRHFWVCHLWTTQPSALFDHHRSHFLAMLFQLLLKVLGALQIKTSHEVLLRVGRTYPQFYRREAIRLSRPSDSRNLMGTNRLRRSDAHLICLAVTGSTEHNKAQSMVKTLLRATISRKNDTALVRI